jgi:hypothetical protein
MDPVTALGVACNALQLFEIAWKLVSGCQSIYRSEHGASEQSRILEAIANDILHLSEAIVLNDDCSSSLRELGRLSKQVASEMLDILNSLKVKVKGKHRMSGSFVAALKEIWHHDKIREFVELLQRLQSQATAHIQYLMYADLLSITRFG